jgi:hypothetical protein
MLCWFWHFGNWKGIFKSIFKCVHYSSFLWRLQELVLCISYFLSNCPLLMFILYFCHNHFSLSMKAMDLKLHRMIEVIKKKCSAKELVLCISYFLSYCPSLIFILYFCHRHFTWSIKAMDMKLYRMIDLIKKKCSA